ncbi:hypothetical protein [Sulfitobacter sp. R18_1]|uniref:hypothetical protein n=1 Tax=Sulfitobacter sp. R18_1 TaxID=2821104 RepID=UPI001ADAF1E5|nr:hypothetical protein [Sulfitobacter sp. R18_1]MBO9427977.1 hypothetical protein [Sulfitobacter sp. R18_1]
MFRFNAPSLPSKSEKTELVQAICLIVSLFSMGMAAWCGIYHSVSWLLNSSAESAHLALLSGKVTGVLFVTNAILLWIYRAEVLSTLRTEAG